MTGTEDSVRVGRDRHDLIERLAASDQTEVRSGAFLRRLETQLADAIDIIASGIRAGSSLLTAIEGARAELDPPLRGDLRLVDSESAAHKDITVTDALRKRYKDAFEGHAKGVETFCLGNDIGYARAMTDMPFDLLVLNILKRGGLVA